MKNIKSAKQMERHLKGIANHYRIEILLLLSSHEFMTLSDIIEKLKANEKTIGEHVRRLFLAGLVNKKQQGNFVKHTLSPYGKNFVTFLKTFQKL